MEKQKELYIYIDESGNMDFRPNERYLVICALIVDEFQGKGVARAVKDLIHEKTKKHKIKELHASQMSFDDKATSISRIVNENIGIRYVLIDKCATHPNFFNSKNACFNYMIYLLLNAVLTDVSVLNLYITVDNRNIKTTSEDSLADYLEVELLRKGIYNKKIHIKYQDSRSHRNLQAVDLFANAIYTKYSYGNSRLYDLFSHVVIDCIPVPGLFDS